MKRQPELVQLPAFLREKLRIPVNVNRFIFIIWIQPVHHAVNKAGQGNGFGD